MAGKPGRFRRAFKRAVIGTAIVGAAAGLGTGAYKAGVSPNSPPAVRSALSGYVRGVDASIAKTKAAGQSAKQTGKAIMQHPATGTIKSIATGTARLAGRIGENAANKPIRTAAGALAVGYAINRAGRRRQETPGKIVKVATGLGAIGGAAFPEAGILAGGSAIAWNALSARRKEQVVTGAANAAGKGIKNAARTIRKTPLPRKRGK